MTVTVYFEDRLGKSKTRQYGPLVLLRAMLADRRGLNSHFSLKDKVDAHPTNGNEALLKKMADLHRQFPAVFVLDWDDIEAMLVRHKREAPSCMSGRKAELRNVAERSTSPLVFIQDNLETIIQGLRVSARCVGASVGETAPWDLALGKDIQAREKVFQNIAQPDCKAVRNHFLDMAQTPSKEFSTCSANVGNLLERVENLLG